MLETHDVQCFRFVRPPIRRNARGHARSWQPLLDIRLERRLGPVLVRWLYVGSLVLIAAVTLFAMLMSWVAGELGRLGLLDGCPDLGRGGLVSALCARLRCKQLIRWIGPEFPWLVRRTGPRRGIPCAVVPPSGNRAWL